MALLKKKGTEMADVTQTNLDLDPLNLLKYVAWRTSQTRIRLQQSQTNKMTDAAKGPPEGSAASKRSDIAKRGQGVLSAVKKGRSDAAKRSAADERPDTAEGSDADGPEGYESTHGLLYLLIKNELNLCTENDVFRSGEVVMCIK
jgi:hypothetical protein